MAQLIDFDKRLHALPHDEAFARTYKGQAHIAGTGPKLATCRMCKHFGGKGYYSKNHCLKDGKCLYPIPGKADKAFPHYASACRFYERADSPPAASRPFDWGED